jgi:hypothetical protein
MYEAKYVAAAFEHQFETIEKVVGFKPEYHNGTGYLDSVVTKLKLNQGEVAKMVDDNGRRCIMVGTLFGTVVVFQRYPDNTDKIVCNYPVKLSWFGLHIGGNYITSERDINHLFGRAEPNVGQKIQNMLKTPEVIASVKDDIGRRVISKF